jgi:hypothetical protein
MQSNRWEEILAEVMLLPKSFRPEVAGDLPYGQVSSDGLVFSMLQRNIAEKAA